MRNRIGLPEIEEYYFKKAKLRKRVSSASETWSIVLSFLPLLSSFRHQVAFFTFCLSQWPLHFLRRLSSEIEERGYRFTNLLQTPTQKSCYPFCIFLSQKKEQTRKKGVNASRLTSGHLIIKVAIL